jgi:AcrR family transcriptional regulator
MNSVHVLESLVAELPDAIQRPKQVRSRDALDRIVAATRRLLRQQSFDRLGVADIARAATISVGAFYTRFPSKEHLLVHLVRETVQESRRRAAAFFAQPDAALTMDGLARGYFSMAADVMDRERAILAPAALLSRLGDDSELRAIIGAFNAAVHQEFADRLVRFTDASLAAPLDRIRFAIQTASAGLREVLLYARPAALEGPAHATWVSWHAEQAALVLVRYLSGPL